MGIFDFHFDLGQWSIPFFKRKSKTILVVDDDWMTVHMIQRAAESAGFELQSAGTAEEAMGILRQNGRRFVLCMIDVCLPSMDGWELRRKLIGSWPRLNVVVMSGSVQSFAEMPEGERLSVLIKPSEYGVFFQSL